MSELYIGLMSGTSLDGIDAGLVDFRDNKCEIIAFHYSPFDETLKQQLRLLSQPDTPVFLTDLGAMDARLGRLFAEAVHNLLANSQIPADSIEAIGSHGLTIYHAPQAEFPFSLQIGDPNIIAQSTGITTVADFRRRDIAAHGQGAPLVPAFHHHFFGKRQKNICVVNIGGIANITVLSNETAIGFDTGPGNTLLDYWIGRNRGKSHDEGGEWARQGKPVDDLLEQLKKDPYFQLAPPKSTGKEYFSGLWLEKHLGNYSDVPSQDIQATLCRLTADTITEAIKKYAPATEETLICGGGCHNHYLLEMIGSNLDHPVSSTDDYGIDPDHVEAIAFAWLARQTLHNHPGNLPKATGAEAPVILGGIYPGERGLRRER
ncbi:anhydro-N-acetylmuramic acid kinase [Methylomarinum vadi]|uniref:anhydro-N-acetylmuramic acid kinase n=1 Tax=Methylomarinum vadi TaxID=438855 RepID=UPI000A014483|nr:anhydro-N-acetylmuramic acid kinase [Methylomarinum vadi]